MSAALLEGRAAVPDPDAHHDEFSRVGGPHADLDVQAAQLPLGAGRRRFDTPELVARCREIGLRLDFWTVNDPALMSRMVDWGVDGLVTDRADLARKVLEARQIRWR